MKKFIVKIEIDKDDDFCESDLSDAIWDGMENIGNYEIQTLEIIKTK